MSIPPKYKSYADARKAGWFSRRHESRDTHEKSKIERQQKFDLKIERAKNQNEKTRIKKEEESKKKEKQNKSVIF